MKVVIACGTHTQGFNRLLDVGDRYRAGLR